MNAPLKDITAALELLDQELAIKREVRELIACGCGVLSVMGVISRQTRDLEKNWELRTDIVFNGKQLTVRALGRRDFIATKLQGLCDRDEFDLEDILALKPTREEIESLRPWLFLRDASEFWPKRVETQLMKLFTRITNG